MKNKSIWINDNKKVSSDKKILEDVYTDILIIGGGITGLTTAYFLRDSKDKITLIDKSIIGMGVTSKTTAKISYLQGTIYQTLEKNFNNTVAKLYLDSQLEAITLIRNIVQDNKISCDFEEADSIIFTTGESGILKIEYEKELLKKWGIDVKDVSHDRIKRGIKVSGTYVFNPMKYIDSLKRILEPKISIYENVLANEILTSNGMYEVKTNCGSIFTKHVVFACHYPFFLVPLFIPLKTYIKREYVNAAKVDIPSNYTALSIDNTLHSIRFYKDYLIYGSNKHRLTSKIDYKENYDKSREDFKKYFVVKPEYTWMNQDIVSNDELPFIGQIKDKMYLATAYNAWGMTNGTLAGKIISDSIQRNFNKYYSLFNPNRGNLSLYINSFLGVFHYGKGYAQSLWKKNTPNYVTIKNVLYGVYVDDDGEKHIIKLICPHMKCNLIFNREEKTWDCPCHGSRFDLDGNVIEGPATRSVDKK